MRGQAPCVGPALAFAAMLAACGGASGQTWVRTLGSDGAEWTRSIVATADGGSLAVAWTPAFDGHGDAWLWRLDGAGTTLWQERVGGPGFDEASDAVQLDDGSFVVVGWRADDTPSGLRNSRAWIFRIDGAGALQWQREFGGSGLQASASRIRRMPGGILVGGAVAGEGGGDPIVLRLDETGALLASVVLRSPCNSEAVTSIAPTRDGGVLLAGPNYNDCTQFPFAARLASDLSIAWQRWYPVGDCGDRPPMPGVAIVEIATGHLMSGDSLSLFELDASGDVTSALRGASRNQTTGALLPLADGAVLTGHSIVPGRGGDLIVAEIDLDGAVRWSTIYGGRDQDQGIAIASVPGGYVVAGQAQPQGPYDDDIAVMRMDADGGVSASCSTVRAGSLFMYPATQASAPYAFTSEPIAPMLRDSDATITATARPPREPCFDCASDAYEPDDSCAETRRSIRAGELQRHSFCDDSDDWMLLDVAAGSTVTVRTQDLGVAADTVVSIVSPGCGAVLASDDDSGGARASLVTWLAPADGRYAVHVAQKDGMTGADRQYTIAVLSSAPPCTSFSIGWSSGMLQSVHAMADGSIVAAGTRVPTAPYGTDDDAWIVRSDAAGVVTLQATFGRIGRERVNQVLPTDDGGLLVVGSTEDDRSIYSAAWLVKLDAAGGVDWSRMYPGDLGSEAIGAAQAPSGYVVAMSARASLPDSREFVRLVGVDARGDVAWQQDFTDWVNASPVAACGFGADGLAVLAHGWLPTGQPCAWIITADASGSIGWQRVLSGDGIEVVQSDIVQAADGSLFVIGSARDVPARTTYAPVVTRLDASGTTLWQRRFPQDPAVLITRRSGAATPDGGLLLAGNVDGAIGGPLWLARLDAAGGITSQSRPSGDVAASPGGIAAASDGGAVLVGTGLGATGPFIARLDPSMQLPPSCRAPIETFAVAQDIAVDVGSGIAPSASARVVPRDVPVVLRAGSALAQEICPCATPNARPPREVSPPGSPSPLVVRKWDLEWEDGAASGSTTFNLYRGEMLDLRRSRSGGGCLRSGLVVPRATDTEIPSTWDRFFFYLVAGRNAAGEGPLGSGTHDPRVPYWSCP